MTQERVNNSYAFVMEDPSKPRKYQLNFQPNDNHQPPHIQHTMDQNIVSHNPQHHSLHHIDHNPPPRQQSITLPPIRELMNIQSSPIQPPSSLPPSLQPSQRILQQQHHHQQHHQQLQQQQQQQQHHHQHHQQQYNNSIHPQHKTESLASSSRPHLPPLIETPHNPSYPFNTTSRNDSHLQISQHTQQQHTQQPSSSHSLPQYTHQHPIMSDVSSYYPPHSYQSNTQYPVNHKINPLPPHTHYQAPPQQMQTPQRISHHHQPHHHHIHHSLPMSQTQPQQQMPQGYHHPPPPSSHHHSHVFNNETIHERSQHDHQPSATSASRVPYSSHPFYSQGYTTQSAPSHVNSGNVPLTEIPSVRDATILSSEQQHHRHHQQNGISGHIQQYSPPQHLQHPQVQPQQPMYVQQQHHQHYHQQHQQHQQQQPQPPQVSHLQVPPQKISRSLTPPQLNVPPQQPQQIQNQLLSENRETSPFHLVPPSSNHHHSESSSSVSTRSSSPAPSTPVTSNNNLPFSNGGIPANNLVHNNNMVDKPLEQNVSIKKKKLSTKPPRPIVPAGPIPNQQSISSNQSLPANTPNEHLVIVQYSNNNNNIISGLPTKSPQASRSRKNSISGVLAPFQSKRGRKAKDSSSSTAQTKPTEETHNADVSSVSTSVPENNEKNVVQNRKREYTPTSDSQNSKRYKKEEKKHNDDDDDYVMEDVTHNAKVEPNMDIDDDERKEDAELLLSLKENNTATSVNSVVEKTVVANQSMLVEPDLSKEDFKAKEDHIITNVATPIIEPVNNIAIEVKSEPVEVTKKVKEMSIKEEKQSYTQERKVVNKSPKKSTDIVKSEVTEKYISSGSRIFTNKAQDKKERIKLTSVNDNSDSDLAMDDGSDDDDQNKHPERNFSANANVQWNSDDMETEEEVEEEIEISAGTGTNNAVKNDQKTNEDVKETNNTNSPNKKLSRPASPVSPCFPTSNSGILSRKASTSSSFSRKGSTSSNGSNKEKDNIIYGSPIETSITSPIQSPPSVKAVADSGNSTTINNNSSSNAKPQRPCPPRRRSTMRDDEKLELNAIEWEKNIEIPHSIWVETLRVFEIVKHSKEMKNRQPHRKRNHILASILFILCRQNGLPRTFVEICNAASIRKQEIGTYYRLMLKVFDSNGLGVGSNGSVDSAEYLKRWCQNLKLPSHILNAAIHVYRQASELNITTGKCPVSVGAASIWLSIHSWNEIRISTYSHTYTDDAEMIKVEHKDVAAAAGVVNATLVGCFKNLLKHKDSLLPEGFLKEARDRSPCYLKPSSTNCANNNNNSECDTYSKLSSPDNAKFYGSPQADNCDNGQSTGETATVESKPSISKSPTKSQIKIEGGEAGFQLLKSPVKVEISTNVDKKEEKSLPVSKSPPRAVPEIEPGQEDADDELEEGELREDDDENMMMD